MNDCIKTDTVDDTSKMSLDSNENDGTVNEKRKKKKKRKLEEDKQNKNADELANDVIKTENQDVPSKKSKIDDNIETIPESTFEKKKKKKCKKDKIEQPKEHLIEQDCSSEKKKCKKRKKEKKLQIDQNEETISETNENSIKKTKKHKKKRKLEDDENSAVSTNDATKTENKEDTSAKLSLASNETADKDRQEVRIYLYSIITSNILIFLTKYMQLRKSSLKMFLINNKSRNIVILDTYCIMYLN